MKQNIIKVKKIIEAYPITNLSSMLVAFIYIMTGFGFDDIIKTCMIFLTTFCAATFLIETIFDTKKKKKYYLLSIFLGISLTIFSKIEIIANNPIYIRILIFYFIIVVTLGIYDNYKKSEKSFSKYLTSTFLNLLEIAIIYGILNIGIVLIIYLIDTLLVNKEILNIDKILLFIIFTFLIPAIIHSFHSYKESNEFIKILIAKILFGLVVSAYIVVYIYFFKVFISFNIPSNIIFRTIAILFIVSIPINIMGREIEDSKFFKKTHNILPYVFIPLIFLECYALGIRIANNGLTIMRYIGIMIIIFEIIYIVIYITKQNEKVILYSFVIELFVTLLIPFVNCYDLSMNNQYKNLLEYKETGKITPKIEGAYNYLNEYKKGKKLINSLLTKQEKNTIEKYYINEDYYNYYFENDKPIDIEGYKTFEVINENKESKINNLELIEKVKKCKEGNNKECFEENNIFIENNNKIIIVSANFSFENGEIIYYDMTYYKLKK